MTNALRVLSLLCMLVASVLSRYVDPPAFTVAKATARPPDHPIVWVGFAGNDQYARALDPVLSGSRGLDLILGDLDRILAAGEYTPERPLWVALHMPQGFKGFDPALKNWPEIYASDVWTGMSQARRDEYSSKLKAWRAARANVRIFVYGGRCVADSEISEYVAWWKIGADGFIFDMSDFDWMVRHRNLLARRISAAATNKLFLAGEAVPIVSTSGDPNFGTFRHRGVDPRCADARFSWVCQGQYFTRFLDEGPRVDGVAGGPAVPALPAGARVHVWIEHEDYRHLATDLQGQSGFIVGAGVHLWPPVRAAAPPPPPPPPPSGPVSLYVSPWGNDAHPGTLEQPKRTIAAAYVMAQAGEKVLLKAGEIFDEPIFLLKSGVSLGVYGDGGRAVIRQRYPHSCVSSWGSDPLDDVTVEGLEFQGVGYDGTTPAGKFDAVSINRHGKNLRWIDCKVSADGGGFTNGFVIQGDRLGRTGDAIVNCIVDGVYTTAANDGGAGVFLSGYSGFVLEGCTIRGPASLDANGLPTWDRSRHMSHAVYAGENNPPTSTFRGNLAAYGGRTNFNIRSGGTVEGNVSIDGAQGVTMGIGYATSKASGRIAGNLITGTRDEQNPEIPLGWGISLCRADGVVIENNLLVHGAGGRGQRAFSIEWDQSGFGAHNVEFRGNVIYDWAPATPVTWPTHMIVVNAPASGVTLSGTELTHLRGQIEPLKDQSGAVAGSGNIAAGTGTYASRGALFAAGEISYKNPGLQVNRELLELAVTRPRGQRRELVEAASIIAGVRDAFSR
jgi:hypothetical protein